MDVDERQREIVKRLQDASAAHFEYETSVLRGVYDQQWAEWYARFLLEHDWDALFERAWTIGDLTDALRQADATFRAAAPQQGWQEFYAGLLAGK